MLSRKTKLLMWFAALIVIMACAPVLTSAPAAPTLDADAINRIIAQTANAASTQTAAAVPTSSPTETPTRLPTNTATEEPAATNTLIFIYSTPTPFVISLATSTFGPVGNKDYACKVLDNPTNGTIYSPRTNFQVGWRLRNAGRKEWESGSVNFVYDSGDRFHKVSSYGLKQNVPIGDVAEFLVEMAAPKDPGTYTAYWTLESGTIKFCKVSLTIGVK